MVFCLIKAPPSALFVSVEGALNLFLNTSWAFELL